MTDSSRPIRDIKPGLPRQGPRPLGLHLSVVLTTLLTSTAGLPLLKDGWWPWTPALRARASALAGRLAAAEGHGLRRALDREIRRRMGAFLVGVQRYRKHPYRRQLADPPTVWREGSSRLIDFGGPGRPVLFVPSLVNRHYVLDLSERRSLMRWLAARGVRPLLIDWGTPGSLERRFTLTDYIAGRLERALQWLVGRLGHGVPVAGYCMGGNLALALAQRRRREVTGLVLMATPWDFRADGGVGQIGALMMAPGVPILEAWGELPVDGLQSLFAALDPWLVVRKFTQFGRLDPTSPQAKAFVALEDWLNDGMGLAVAVARDCLLGWYGRNDPIEQGWLVAGLPVDPRAVTAPTLVLIPQNDRIVPPASAQALATALPRADVLDLPLGHIGMVVSGGAERLVWQPLADWLRQV